ncbi:S24 family peptidase [Oceaniglobus trochenteri]|uniref:S24 family peptidase n=1 Tax=Oceaniglobus trochenteri TaxID=2763260 RepID=UPI001CFF65A4|nr:S24 family peptidase [Oceaniglobus trochenteri]
MEKADILKVIEDRIAEMGWTIAGASEAAVGNRTLISNMRRERHGMPSLENLSKLAQVLNLELYFGLPRQPCSNTDSDQDDQKPLADYHEIRRYDAQLSAGPGANGDNTQPLAPVAFRSDWLAREGLIADRCMVVTVKGDSMEPRLMDGDLVLIDRRMQDLRDGHIYAFIDVTGDARIKRIEWLADQLLLLSDNPDYPTEARTERDGDGFRILGRVVWHGHSWTDKRSKHRRMADTARTSRNKAILQNRWY